MARQELGILITKSESIVVTFLGSYMRFFKGVLQSETLFCKGLLEVCIYVYAHHV